jgi:hypothetical protein
MVKTPQRKKPKGRRKDTIARARQLENLTIGLRHLGFQEFGAAEFKNSLKKPGTFQFLPSRYMVRDFPHETPWFTPGKKERYINDNGIEYIFEAKMQNGSGSVDEKVCLLWECFCVSSIPNWIVCFDGNWYRHDPRGIAIVAWLRRRIEDRPIDGKQFYVCANDDEWVALVHRLFQQAEP